VGAIDHARHARSVGKNIDILLKERKQPMTGGYCYGQQAPLEDCPYCKFPCEADFVDIGVGFQQCGPYHCEQCGASEIGPNDEVRNLSDIERERGWYGPGSVPGSSANVIKGKVVSHRQANKVYRDEFIGNPLHDAPGYVEAWREKLRKGKS
jgi:hypothetical protein